MTAGAGVSSSFLRARLLRLIGEHGRCVQSPVAHAHTLPQPQPPPPDRKPFTILALDGGGVRGVFTLAVLKRLEEACPGFLSSVDLFAGTSTGAIIALSLAAGLSVHEIQDSYIHASPEIFKPRQVPLAVMGKTLWRAKYDSSPLGSYLARLLGGEWRTLGDLERRVLVTAFRIDGRKSSTHAEHITQPALMPEVYHQWRPAFFSNMTAPDGGIAAMPDNDLTLVDAALRSSAAPTFFPAHQGYVDGAIFANNPSLLATLKALAHHPGTLRREDVRVLSIGAGSRINRVPQKTLAEGDWGLMQWAPHLVSLLMDSNQLTADMAVTFMLNRRQYVRLECALFPEKGLNFTIDEVASMPRLIEMAEQVDVDHAVQFVRDNFTAPHASRTGGEASTAAALDLAFSAANDTPFAPASQAEASYVEQLDQVDAAWERLVTAIGRDGAGGPSTTATGEGGEWK